MGIKHLYDQRGIDRLNRDFGRHRTIVLFDLFSLGRPAEQRHRPLRGVFLVPPSIAVDLMYASAASLKDIALAFSIARCSCAPRRASIGSTP
jgi:hypothetical protein